MSPNLLLYGGIAVCGVAAVGSIISIISFRLHKTRLDKRLDALYGQRRR